LVLATESFSRVSGRELESLFPHLDEQVCFPSLRFVTLKRDEQMGQTFPKKVVFDERVAATFLLISSLAFEVEKDRLHLELQNLPLA
jgi:hypothetical protein